ncbi:MAG: 50S ribosomal protein L6 [Candidatus Paceibacterota bacterium]
MSRVGKQVIEIPSGTTVEVKDGSVFVVGKGGTLSRKLHDKVSLEINGSEVKVVPANEELATQALWGTFASHVINMVAGVNTPFEKKLVVEGVGFRAELQGKELVLNLGFSHPIKMSIPEDLDVAVEKNVITVRGADKESVGQFSATVRALKKPEPYKGKGIHYSDEEVRRKQGKKSV